MLRQAVSHPVPSPVSFQTQRDASIQLLPKSLPRASPAMLAQELPFSDSSVVTPVLGLQPASARHPGSGSGAGVATTLPTQRHQHQHYTPYSRHSILVGVSGNASAEYMTSQASFATVFPTSYVPDGLHGVWPPVDADMHVMFAGAGYANNNVCARVVGGRIVPRPPVPRFDAPTDRLNVHAPPVDWHGAPYGSAHSPIVDVPREHYAESSSLTNPVPAPFSFRSRQVYNPEDEIFDIEALERSLADSPTSTSSSLSDTLVNSYAAPGWARAIGAPPAQYAGTDFVAVRGWSGAHEPEGSTWHTNPGAYHVTLVGPPSNALPDKSFIETNVNAFGETLSTNPLSGAIDDDHVFDDCFDESGPSWLPQSLAFGDSILKEEFDFAPTASGSTHCLERQTADSYIGSAAQNL